MNLRGKNLSAFDKLRSRGHLKYYQDLNIDEIRKLEAAEASYIIPWDVQFKESSISTPTCLVLDASTKTNSGYSLNNILCIGIPDLVKLYDVVLEWQVGPVVIVGDISQFYPSVGLYEECWPFQ